MRAGRCASAIHAAVIAGALLLCGLPCNADTPARDWPGFLGENRDGKSSESGLELEWPEQGPPVLWDREIGDGYSMASIADGRLYLFDRHDDQERLTCLNAETGAKLWSMEYPTDYEDMYGFSGGPRANPLIDDGHVYTFGVDGMLRCQRAGDGKLVWEVDTENEFGVIQNFFGVGSNPVIEGDLLIVPVGGSPEKSPGIQSGEAQGNGSGIVAFHKKTGAVRYKLTDELASYSSPMLATIGDRRWGFFLARGGFIGFDPSNGKQDFFLPWRARKLESVNAATPVVSGDKVFITESYGPGSALLKVRPGGYDVVWKDESRRGQRLSSHWATPILHEGTLYGCHGEKSGSAELRAVNFGTGEVNWSEKGLGRTTLLYVDGHLVVLGERGKLLVIKATPDKYEKIAEVELTSQDGKPLIAYPAWNAPILANGLLYVRGADRLVCLDLRSSRK